MFVYDYHLNDPTTFLHYQIQVFVCMTCHGVRKCIFRDSRARARDCYFLIDLMQKPLYSFYLFSSNLDFHFETSTPINLK